MNDEPLLPHRATLLGEALRPLRQKIETQLDLRARPTMPVLEMLSIVSGHLDKLAKFGPRLTDRIDSLASDVLANESATDSDVYRAVGRFEGTTDDVLSGYSEVCALDASGRDVEARDLLVKIYRHTLTEIRDWLNEVIETLTDPKAAIRRRGLSETEDVRISLV
ncbi:MAG: hypothetical protein LBB65_01225 [Burkholderiales bacterium]|jgi:hypothetical protein|nr:hypothetical protein [Burkholderiales bacterium]